MWELLREINKNVCYRKLKRKVKRPPGIPTHTWIEQIKQDLDTINVRLDLNKLTETINMICHLPQNRDT